MQFQQHDFAKRFTNGQPFTFGELSTAYQRITGRPVPAKQDMARLAKGLIGRFPDRFEFEINRQRGFAFDHDEIPDPGHARVDSCDAGAV